MVVGLVANMDVCAIHHCVRGAYGSGITAITSHFMNRRIETTIEVAIVLGWELSELQAVYTEVICEGYEPSQGYFLAAVSEKR